MKVLSHFRNWADLSQKFFFLHHWGNLQSYWHLILKQLTTLAKISLEEIIFEYYGIMGVLNHFENLGKRVVPNRNGDLNFSFPHSPSTNFILFYTETYKIRRTTCLITIVFEACYLSKLGLMWKLKFKSYCIYPLLPFLKIAKKAISWQKLIMWPPVCCLGLLLSLLVFTHPDWDNRCWA